MFSQYFGNFLLNKGLVTPSELDKAIELQKTAHLKLGVLCVNAGYMTPTQIEEVHQKQTQVDKRFGELAIELGYLTEEQLEEILSTQKHSHLLLGQVLIDENILTLDEFTSALNQYKEEFSLSDEQFEAIKKGDIETLVDTVLELGSSQRAKFIKDYLTLMAKNMIRFVEDQLRMEPVKATDNLKNDYLVYQQIHGDATFFTAILADEKVFIDIAAKYAQEEITEVDELAEASVSEFLNLHNGIFTVNMSNREIELEMQPQQVRPNGQLSNLEDAGIVKVTIPSGEFYVVFTDQQPAIN